MVAIWLTLVCGVSLSVISHGMLLLGVLALQTKWWCEGGNGTVQIM